MRNQKEDFGGNMKNLTKLGSIVTLVIMIGVSGFTAETDEIINSDVIRTLGEMQYAKYIKIVTPENKKFTGNFIRFDNDKITLRTRKTFKDYPIADISKIYYRKITSPIIAVATSSIGMVIGYSIGKQFENFFGSYNPHAPYYGAGSGLAIGALVGMVFIAITSKWVAMYEKPLEQSDELSSDFKLNLFADKNGGARLTLSLNF